MSIKTVINHKEYTLLNLSTTSQLYGDFREACGIVAQVRVTYSNDLADENSVWAPSDVVCDGVNYAYLVGPAVPEFNSNVDSLTQRAAAIAYFKETIPAEVLLPVGVYGATPEEINTERANDVHINEGILKIRKSDGSRFGLFFRTGEMTEPLVERIIPVGKDGAGTMWIDLAVIPCIDELTNYACHIDWTIGSTQNKQVGFAIDGDKLKS